MSVKIVSLVFTVWVRFPEATLQQWHCLFFFLNTRYPTLRIITESWVRLETPHMTHQPSKQELKVLSFHRRPYLSLNIRRDRGHERVHSKKKHIHKQPDLRNNLNYVMQTFLSVGNWTCDNHCANRVVNVWMYVTGNSHRCISSSHPSNFNIFAFTPTQCEKLNSSNWLV